MKLLRLLAPLAITFACALYTPAQQPACTLKQAPEFNGFRIGMLPSDVRDNLADTSMFDSKLTSANKTGAQAVRISGAELKEEYAEGIDEVNLTFVDKRLAVIRATYHGGISWGGAQEFFKQISERLSLPQPSGSAQTRGSRGNEKYRLECTGFVVSLAYSFGVSPNVTIYDAAAHKLVNERSEKNPDGEVKDIRISPGRPPVVTRPR